MIVLDPFHFLPQAPGQGFTADRIKELKQAMRRLLRICKKFGEKICCDRKAWRDLQLSHIRPILDNANDPELDVALEALREHIVFREVLPAVGGRTWGVKALFNGFATADDSKHAAHVVHVALTCLREGGTVRFFVRESVPRNIILHAVGHSSIFERTRWRIYVSERGLEGPVAIPCITSVRNVEFEWTTRYDMGLPGNGTYAFAPKQDWHLKRTKVIGVDSSKYVFVDNKDNGWAKPNTPGKPYHWDVYVNDEGWRKQVGLNQINVCRSDVPEDQGIPGEIHHVPKKKSAAYKGK